MIRVLIVDDHPVVRGGLKGILTGESDFEVWEAGNANEALAMIDNKDFNLVVLDLDLPGKGGLDVLAHVKGDHPALPVLILSVYPEEQFALRTLKAGASGFLSKNAAPEDLVDAIRKILHRGKYISEATAEKLLHQVKAKPGHLSHESLSEREFQILCLLGEGKTVSDIAEELSLSVSTVSTYRARVLEKMGMKTTAELMHYVIRNRLVN